MNKVQHATLENNNNVYIIIENISYSNMQCMCVLLTTDVPYSVVVHKQTLQSLE